MIPTTRPKERMFAPIRLREGTRAPDRMGVARALSIPDLDAPDAAVLAAAAGREQAVASRVEAARAAGFAAGEAAGRAAAAAEQAAADGAALAAIAQALQGADGEARAAVEAAATSVAALLLTAVDAALPAAAARNAVPRAVLLAGLVAPMLEAAGRVTLHVAPGLAEASAARINDARIEVRGDAGLAPGEVTARWAGGGAALTVADARAAIAEALQVLGLEGTDDGGV